MGSHQELLAKRGLYWKLYQLQYKDQEAPMHTSHSSNIDRNGSAGSLREPSVAPAL